MKFSRRNFLQGTSAFAITASIPSFAEEAKAWSHGIAIATPSGFNGGVTQTNSLNAQSGGDFKFINFIKSSQQIGYNSPPTDPTAPPIPVLELDTNGYPTSLVAGTGGYGSVFTMPNALQWSPSVAPSGFGNWVLKWDDTGTVTVTTPSQTTVSSVAGRIVFTNNDTTSPYTSARWNVTAIGSPYLKNLRLCRDIDEAAMDAGEQFYPPHIALMKTAKPGAIRSLGWGGGFNGVNTSVAAVWADRRPTGYITWMGGLFNPNWCPPGGTGSAITTTSNGTDYSLVWSGFTLTDKVKVNCLFNVAWAKTGLPTFTNAPTTNGSPINIPYAGHGLSVGNAVCFGNQRATFVGSISGTTLTVTSGSGIDFSGAYTIFGSGLSPVAAGTIITSQLSGTGGIGTYTVSLSQTVASQSIYQSACPAPLISGVTYFVSNVVDANNFNVAATFGGSTINALATGTSTFNGCNIPRININSTGFVPITPSGYFPQGTNNFVSSIGISVGLNALVYDATTHGFYRSTEGTFINGSPPEAFNDYCGEIGAMPWMVAPFLTVEPVSDYMTSWASDATARYPWMKPLIEPPNETWNGSAGFLSSFYVQNLTLALWNVQGDTHNGYGKWVSTLGQAISAVYGNDRTKYSMICACQQASFVGGAGTGTANDPRLKSILYVSVNGGSPAYLWTDRVCISTYYSPAERFTTQEPIDAFNYAVTNGGTINPSTPGQITLANSYAQTADTGINQSFTLTLVMNAFTNLKAWAQGMPGGNTIAGAVGYEGGWSPDLLSGNWTTLVSTAAGSITQANPCVVTLNIVNGTASSEKAASGITGGSPAVVGMAAIFSGVGGMTQLNNAAIACTFPASSSANIAATNTLLVNQAVTFATVPSASGLTANFTYYVVAATGTTFQISLTRGGSAILFSGGGSATGQPGWFVTAITTNTITLDVSSSAFSPWTSGGTITWMNSQTYSNTLRIAGGNSPTNGTINTKFYGEYFGLAGTGWVMEFPSNFIYFGNGNVWFVVQPSMYGPLTPQWNSIVAAN